jgi:hypothetical protein
VTVLLLRSVETRTPAGLARVPASASAAFGLVGSAPGRSLASGWMVIGCPTSPRAVSGWATGGAVLVAVGPSTVTGMRWEVGAETPSATS